MGSLEQIYVVVKNGWLIGTWMSHFKLNLKCSGQGNFVSQSIRTVDGKSKAKIEDLN